MSKLYKNKYRSATARAQWWDYTRDAAYFVTVCTQDRAHVFGEVRNGEMHLSEIGRAAQACWDSIPDHFAFVACGAFIVMPNHVHGILVLDHGGMVSVGSLHATALPKPSPVAALHATPPQGMMEPPSPPKNEYMASISPKPGSLSTIVRSYKSAVTKQVRPAHPHFGWQSRFHEHIIRDGEAYTRIERYIIANPSKWDSDKLNGPRP